MLKAHPRGRKDMPLLGVLATRVARRPNPIGLTLVELVERRGNVLTITGLDAFDGTPVLDIKPFDYWDMTKDARVPEWWMRLEAERKIHRRALGMTFPCSWRTSQPLRISLTCFVWASKLVSG